MRLLLVEDTVELANWLQKALTQKGFAVDWVADGVAADHVLQSEDYALVVLDVSLPRLDGLAVLARLRKRGQRVPVLLLTAQSALQQRVQGLNAGADDYLTKPFELDELDARLRAQSGAGHADAKPRPAGARCRRLFPAESQTAAADAARGQRAVDADAAPGKAGVAPASVRADVHAGG